MTAKLIVTPDSHSNTKSVGTALIPELQWIKDEQGRELELGQTEYTLTESKQAVDFRLRLS